MPKKEKKAKQNNKPDKNSSTNVYNIEADVEERLTKDIVDQNRKWALTKNRKNKYTGD